MGREVAYFYLQKACIDGISFTAPFLVIYLLSYVSLGQVILLSALQFLVASLLEIPSGLFADVIGKRESLMLGAALNASAICLFFFGNSLWQFGLAFIFIGAGNAFISGSNESLIYDFLEKKKQKGSVTKLFARGDNYAARVTDLSYLIAGVIAIFNIRLVFVAEFIKWVLVFVVSRLAPLRKKSLKKSLSPFYASARSSASFMLSNKHFSYLIIISSFVYAVFMITTNYYQPLMKSAGISVAFFGFVYVLLNQSRIISTRLALSVSSRFSDQEKLLVSSILVKGLVLVALAVFVNPLFVVALLMVKVGVEGFRKPFFTSYIAGFAPKGNRATILSFSEFAYSIIFVFLSVVFKFVTDNYSVYEASFLAGCMLLFFFLLFRTEVIVLKSHTLNSKKS